MSDDPFRLFDRWLDEAAASEPNDPNAMALSTVDADGRPSSRMVLLKGHGPEGFVFYSHSASVKGRAIAGNPAVALLFHWKTLRRQVRIEGDATEVPGVMADAYWATRGRDSQLGAWASDQSQPLDARETFEARVEATRARFEGADVPRPDGWIGWQVTPARIELWHDREHRLHERRLFVRDGEGWREGLLYP